MTRPTSLLIAGQTFSVDWVARDGSLSPNAADPHRDLGTSSPPRQRIAIREGQGFESERDTVLHEVLHVVIELTSNSDRFTSNEALECVVNALAVGVLAVLRHSGGLAAYLTEAA